MKETIARQSSRSAETATRAFSNDAFGSLLATRPSLELASLGAANDERSGASMSLDFLRSPVLLSIDFVLVLFLGVAASDLYYLVAYSHVGNLLQIVSSTVVIAIFYCAILRLQQRDTNRFIARSGLRRLRVAGVSWFSAFTLFIFLLFILKAGASVSRGATILFFALGLPVVTGARIVIPKLLSQAIGARPFGRRTAIVLADSNNLGIAETLRQLRVGGLHPSVLTVNAGVSADQWTFERANLLGRALSSAHKAGTGAIFIASQGISFDRLNSITVGLGRVPRAVHVLPDRNTSELLRNRLVAFGAAVSLEVQKEPLTTGQRAAKRLMDIFASVALLVFLVPVLALLSIGVKLDSPGPVFFRQNRNGAGGRRFRIVKFRTMRVLEDGHNIVQAQKNDPRVTSFGSWLRKTSLDELPQLFNVLRGEMSLVGPRPHAIAHDELYTQLVEDYEIRQHVKPGITGWAQVNGLRGETSDLRDMSRRIDHDLWYARNASLGLDLKILLKTFGVVFGQRNAY